MGSRARPAARRVTPASDPRGRFDRDAPLGDFHRASLAWPRMLILVSTLYWQAPIPIRVQPSHDFLHSAPAPDVSATRRTHPTVPGDRWILCSSIQPRPQPPSLRSNDQPTSRSSGYGPERQLRWTRSRSDPSGRALHARRGWQRTSRRDDGRTARTFPRVLARSLWPSADPVHGRLEHE